MALIPRRNASDIAKMPEFAASRKRKRLTEEDMLDEEGVSILIPEWFQKQNIPYLFAENGRFGTKILGFLIDLLSVSGPGGHFGTKVAPILD